MKFAWLFPGQGSQTVGMGKALVERSASARRVFESADRALGRAISALCFEGPQDELTRTENAQPALVATSIALLEALRERYPSLPAPVVALGHSLGEYSALVASSALPLEAAVKLVEFRGSVMQEAVPQGAGAMAAIMGGDRAAVTELCASAAQGEVLEPANFNAPGQVVISGHAAAVARAVELAPERRLKAIPLKVSAPFHCSLMAPAARRMETALGALTFSPFAFPVIANVSAEPNSDPGNVRDLLVRQVDSPVLWEESVSKLADLGVTHALEIGPGKVLAGLVKRIDKRIAVSSVSDFEGVEALASTLDAAS